MAFSSEGGFPASTWASITPSNTVNLPAGVIGVYVGGAGAVVLVGKDNTAVTFAAVPVGTVLQCGARRVNSTGTTATNLVALF